MPKVPAVSGDQAVRAFQRLGDVVVRPRGSHLRLHHPAERRHRPLTIPRHRELGRGLLRTLLRDASVRVEEFLSLRSYAHVSGQLERLGGVPNWTA